MAATSAILSSCALGGVGPRRAAASARRHSSSAPVVVRAGTGSTEGTHPSSLRASGLSPPPAAAQAHPASLKGSNISPPPAAAAPTAPASTASTASFDWEKLDAELMDKSALQIMDRALEIFGDGLAIAFSGAEDVALIQYAHFTGRPYRVFSLDTGRLNPETYQLFHDVEKHFGIRIEYCFPAGPRLN